MCWVFVSVRGLSLVAASGGHSSSRCVGLSLSRPLLLQSTGSRRAGSVGVAHGPSCSAACGIFPDQGSNPCPLHWQADSQPLRHQGSPEETVLFSENYDARWWTGERLFTQQPRTQFQGCFPGWYCLQVYLLPGRLPRRSQNYNFDHIPFLPRKLSHQTQTKGTTKSISPAFSSVTNSPFACTLS